MPCPACAAAVPDAARFCPSCGTALTPASASTVSASTVSASTVSASTVPADARKVVTVLFCDLAGSTTLSGQLDPESLRSVTMQYFDLVRARLERHGGLVEKFIGDAVMAVFGLPVLHEDDPLRAARAALDILGALAELNLGLDRLYGVALQVRIGINTGDVVAPGDPTQALVAGEVVNVAARLQTSAAPGQIFLGPVTAAALGRSAVTESAGLLSLKGKADPVAARRLLEVRDDDPAIARRFDSRFVGRDAELAALDAALDRVTLHRHCALVTVFGEAGIGKTRLLREWLASIPGSLLAGTCRCRSYGSAGTLAPLADALRPLVPGTPQPVGDLADSLAVLQAGVFRDGTPDPSLDEVCWAVTCLLEHRGREGTVILVFDDCQWAASSLLDVLERVAADVREAPLLLVCAGRPDLLEDRPGWGRGLLNATALALPPLPAAYATALAADLTAGLAEVAAHTADPVALVDRAEGNPLFLEQLLGAVADGSVRQLPPTINALVSARIESLEPDERTVLDCAAIIGRDFGLAEVAALRPVAESAVTSLLTMLVRRRLIDRTPGRSAAGHRFASGLIQEVAYRSIPRRVRARRHRELADWFAGRDAGDEIIGLHLDRALHQQLELGLQDEDTAGLRVTVARRLAAAGANALRRADLVRAAQLSERAAELLGPHDPAYPAIAVRLAEARLALGQVNDGLALLRQALARADVAGDALTGGHARLLLAGMTGTADIAGPAGAEGAADPVPGAAARVARAVLPGFEQAGDDLGQARAWLRIGQDEQRQGRFGDAWDVLRRALGHAIRADAELERATVVGALAMSAWLGPLPAAGALRACQDLAASHGDGRLVSRATVNCPMAMLAAIGGDFAAARDLLDAACRILDDCGHAHAAGFIPLFSGQVELLAGRNAAAAEALGAALAAADRIGDSGVRVVCARVLARLALAQGQPRQALALTDGDEAGPDAPLDLAELAGIRASALASLGEQERALRLARQAVTAVAGTDSISAQGAAALDLAVVLAAGGSAAAAATAAATAAERFTAKGHLIGRQRAAELSELR
jgi:class 3 adenylate cyclase/tetratricopeptide (TPR) repeat protein